MAECSICKKPLVCKDHGVQQEEWTFSGWISNLITPAQQVKPCAAQKGAIWVHVTDETGKDIPGVSTTVKGTKSTEIPGVSVFDQLDPGPYKAKLEPLPPDLDKRYIPPTTIEVPENVAGGDVKYVHFELKRKKWTLNVKTTSATPGAWPEDVQLILPSPLSNTNGKCDNGPWQYTQDGIANVAGQATVSCDGWTLLDQPKQVKLDPGETQTIEFSLKRKPWIKFLVKKKLGAETKVFTKLTVKAKLPGWAGPEFVTDRAETHIQKLEAGTGEIEAMTADEPWEFESIDAA